MIIDLKTGFEVSLEHPETSESILWDTTIHSDFQDVKSKLYMQNKLIYFNTNVTPVAFEEEEGISEGITIKRKTKITWLDDIGGNILKYDVIPIHLTDLSHKGFKLLNRYSLTITKIQS
jgi:hypothetical protein